MRIFRRRAKPDQELLNMFADGSGFGDPDARRNAEQRLQVLLAKEQKIANRLNWFTLLVASSTCIIVIVLINPDISLVPGPPSPSLILLPLAVLFALFAVILMLALYGTFRQLDRFDDYKAEFEKQWGPIDQTPEV